ncbi:hypothetical protein [Botrimarina hoheduenensis]|uniref:PEP-CTERM protein-sorting domain-containing protein n=1 Tax=Botrimarina hoheduenensis TaxID=2528000 RepID=A0A5C5VYD6_9BACT|nr:hypothetical protein [Botrimarina hoheduenensis]TWT43430.1 hypothetical protein Pla111_23810 [Botrimarina hoheduenensis]
MKRAALFALGLNGLLLSSALAGPFDYGFDGTLSDHFVPLFPNPNSTITQNDVTEQVEYTASDGDLSEENGTGLEHINFRPRYDQSWRVAVDVTLPAGYDTSFLANNPANQDNGRDTWIELGIFAFTSFDDRRVFSSSLEVILDGGSVVQRNVASHHDLDDSSRRVPTTDTSVRLTLGYDHLNEVLSAFAGDTQIHTANLGAASSDWQMTDSDTFSIGIFGSTGFQAVSADNPLIHDNFTAAIIPEPATQILALLAVTCLRPVRGLRA